MSTVQVTPLVPLTGPDYIQLKCVRADRLCPNQAKWILSTQRTSERVLADHLDAMEVFLVVLVDEDTFVCTEHLANALVLLADLEIPPPQTDSIDFEDNEPPYLMGGPA